MSKCSVKNCSKGWLFDNKGNFKGRCLCKINEYKETYFDWSGIPDKKRYFKTINELEKTFPIYFNMEGSKSVDFKEELQLLVDMKDELLNKGILLLKGLQATGKTQFAASLAQSIFSDIDWDVDDNELTINPYLFININSLILNSVFFNNEKLEVIQKKIKNSKILIIDEFGDELNRKTGDGQLAKALDFLKETLDEFDGLIILTTNNIHIEKDFIEKTKRADIHSRLFGNIEKRDNVLVYGFQLLNGRDLRDEEKRDKMNSLKNRF